jgi:hypothetical protein
MLKWIAVMLVFAAIALAPGAPALAGDSGSSAWSKLSALLGKPEEDHFKVIHVADLAALRTDDNGGLAIYDANTAKVRAQYGKIPGATLLSSPGRYEPSELPPNKNVKLVFYCTNSR